ncbi:hypothetical protein D3C81_1145290 [compost metagenome]
MVLERLHPGLLDPTGQVNLTAQPTPDAAQPCTRCLQECIGIVALREQLKVRDILSSRFGRHQVVQLATERLGKMVLAESCAGDHVEGMRHQYLVARYQQLSRIGRVHTEDLLLTSEDEMKPHADGFRRG